MAIEFSIEAKNLLHGLKPFFAGRPRGKVAGLEYLDIKAQNEEVEIVSTGLSASFGAEVTSSGCARIPYPIFEALFRKPEKYGISRLVIHIEKGEIKAGSTTFNHPGISIHDIGARIADLPIDASVVDALLLTFRYNPKELADSGLEARGRAAQQQADDLIDRASKLLEPLEITREELAGFVSEHFRKRATEE